ncbi:hypothetical protein GCM10023340_05180 [Nocardioides marinquilinus]|uniref:CsbD-like domain-containing protein n=1 Tax=Nocardioides marinquilinus TaxID=1210400 RepID=A0ABP9P809_9ACTN
MSTDDKAEHKGQEMRGKVKEGAGKLTGDDKLEQQGKNDQAESKLKQGVDKVKDAVKDVTK